MVMDADKLVGIFFGRGHTRKVALLGKKSRESLVADLKTSPVPFVTPNNRSRECMALMSEKNIRHLPVMIQRWSACCPAATC